MGKGTGKQKQSKKQIAERVERICRYEDLLDTLISTIADESPTEEVFCAARETAEALAAYYESDDWKQDFAADEAGLLPRDLRRGVLSEDGIYNALEAYREWAEAAAGEKE